jgi:superfamily II DNA or RNA helicase
VSFEKRSYETRAVSELRDLLKTHKRVIAVGPTGCGKTVIASLLIRNGIRDKRWRRVLFVAHRYELIDQAYKRLATAGLRCGILMASEEALNGTERVDQSAPVQIASVQTIARRGVPADIDLIVFDEAHRVMADSYQGIAASQPKAEMLGLTATPCRQDGRGLGAFFAHMYEIAKPSELYAAGYLAKPRVLSSPEKVVKELAAKTKPIRAVHGDFDAGQLELAIDTSKLVGSIVSESIKWAPRVPKVVFAAGVRHSQNIAALFRRRGISAVHIDGETQADIRSKALADLASGRVEVVCNVDVLSEGWDLPALGSVVIARPTKSRARFLQMGGRVQRVYGKRVPIILDHGNNSARIGVIPGDDVPWSLDDEVKRARDAEPIYYACAKCQAFAPTTASACPECGTPRPVDPRKRELEEVKARLEEIRSSRLAEMRDRIEKFAVARGVPSAWVDRVLMAMATQ